MATPRDIDLQGLGLTGRRKLLPPPLPPKYDLGLRRAPVEPAGIAPVAGLDPAATGTIKPDFGAGLRPDGGAALTPGMTGDVPNEVPDLGLSWDDVKGVVIPAGLGFLGGLASPVPGGAAIGTAKGIQAGLMGKGINWAANKYVAPTVNKYVVDPIMDAFTGPGERWRGKLGTENFNPADPRSVPGTVTQKDLEKSFPGPQNPSDRNGLFSAPDVTQSDLESSFPGPDKGWFDENDSDDDTPVG